MSKNTRLVVLVVIATLVAFAGIGAFMVLQFGRTPPSSAVYGATIQASSYGCPSTYLGQYPSQAYWLILTVVLGNTGGLALTPGPLDWVVSDVDGGHPAFATSQFYMTQTVLRGQSGNFTLAFDMTSSAVPSVLTLTLPNGNHPTALFSGCPPALTRH